MDEILERVRARFAALSPEAFSATLKSVADHPIVKALEAVLQDEELISDSESVAVFMKTSLITNDLDYRMEFESLIKMADFFAANDSNFLLAA